MSERWSFGTYGWFPTKERGPDPFAALAGRPADQPMVIRKPPPLAAERTIYVNEYPGGSLLAYETKEQAEKAAYPERMGSPQRYRKVEDAAHDEQ